MTSPHSHTLPKEERLCGKTSVSALISGGKWGGTAHLRYCWMTRQEGGANRLMVSVPKRFFKRAVRRNLLKRRMRDAYRLQKELLSPSGVDLLLSYAHPQVADFATLYGEVTEILGRIRQKRDSGSAAGITEEGV